MSRPEMLRRPGEWLPIAMSLLALALVVVHVTRFGATREADEGATAHLWQLLMAGQVPVMACALITGVRRTPRPALTVLAWQLLAALGALAPVYFLHL